MSSLQVSLFGPPQIRCDGGALHIPRRKTLALLAYLVTMCRPHSREALTGIFWPEDDPDTARANLRRALSELKQAAGADVLDIDRSQVGISSACHVDMDVARFKQGVAQARGHAHTSLAQCAACMGILAEAVALYTGDFMAGFTLPDSPPFDEWQFFEAESLRQLLGQSLEMLARGLARQGTHEQAIEYARRWVALDPLHEPAHRELMRLYASAGRKEAALRQYAECVRVLAEELGIEPEAETLALHQAIRSGRVAGAAQGASAPGAPRPEPPQVVLHNLPLRSGPLVGRKSELERIAALLRPGDPCRLLTLTGPGGAGKTRLAVEAAATLAHSVAGGYQDGIWFISLAKADSSGRVSAKSSLRAEIAQGLGFAFPPDDPQPDRDLIEFLQQKQILLVLDDFDSLIDEEAVGLLLDILSSAPRAKILVTSRTRLGCRDEHIIVVGGLQTPGADSTKGAEGYEAVEMFVRCAVRIRSDFALTPENAAAVVRVCQLVHGMPLAIELAAAWIEVLSPAEIAGEIAGSLDFLEARWQDLPDRQRSLRAVFESSWAALGEADREILMALTVFKSGFTRQEGALVASASLKSLLALAHRSWLGYDAAGRYSMHELLRQYAGENLAAAAGAHEQVMRRFCACFNAFLDEQAVALRGPGQREATAAIKREFENIRTAWTWQVTHGAVEAAVEHMLPALYLYAEALAYGIDLREMVTAAVEALRTSGAWPRMPRLQAVLLTAGGGFNASGRPLGDASQLFTPLERRFVSPEEGSISQAWSLVGGELDLLSLGVWGVCLAHLHGRINEPTQGIRALRRLALEFHEQGKRWEEALALAYSGMLLKDLHGWPGASPAPEHEIQRAFSNALAIFQDLGDLRQSAFVLKGLGIHAYFREDGRAAIDYFQTARGNLLAAGDRPVAASLNGLIAWAHFLLCDYDAWSATMKAQIQEYLELGYYGLANLELSWLSLHLARTGDLGEARRLREQSLELAPAREDKWAKAWQVWEMGDLYRIEGDLSAARRWYDRARDMFIPLAAGEALAGQPWAAFYERGLGQLAQASGKLEEARHHFEESLRVADDFGHDWPAAYALLCLGGVETSLGQYRESGAHLREGYRRAAARRHPELILSALAGLAALRLAEGERDRAAALANLVVSHPASWTETRAQAAQVLRDAGSAPPASPGWDPQTGCGADELAKVAVMLEAELDAK